LAASTSRRGSVGSLGGFAGVFDLAEAGYRDPMLLAATDGVGTKLKIAIAADRHDGIGIDLVAMCVNDLVVAGGEPLLFLDYYATGHLEVETGRRIVAGIAAGCRLAGCALIGGETAELPGLYAGDDYDLAGFAVGAVERQDLLDGSAIGAGDVILGLASDGLHANGFSLVRAVIADYGFDYAAAAPFAPPMSLAEALLVPTRIYVRSCLTAIRHGGIHGLCHVTGGGIGENLVRVLPAGLTAELDGSRWPVPPVFRWLADVGGIEPDEMLRTFNCGIGMILVVDSGAAEAVSAQLQAAGETVHVIGQISPAETPQSAASVGLSTPSF